MGEARVLIVDDEPAILTAFQYALQDKDWHIEVAPTAQAGLMLFEKERFDVVVTDKNLPDFDGIKLLTELREQDVRTQFIVITGYASPKSAIDAANLGAFEYLAKPFKDIYAVAEMIESAVIRSQKSPGDELVRLFDRMAARSRGEILSPALSGQERSGNKTRIVAYAPVAEAWLKSVVESTGSKLVSASTKSAFQEAIGLFSPETVMLVGRESSLPLARITRELLPRTRILVVFEQADVPTVRSFILAGANAMVSDPLGTPEAETRLRELLG